MDGEYYNIMTIEAEKQINKGYNTWSTVTYNAIATQ